CASSSSTVIGLRLPVNRKPITLYAPYDPPWVLVEPRLPDALDPVVPELPVVPVEAMLLTLERARSYASRPRSTICLTLALACEWESLAMARRRPAWSRIWDRSSAPDFGANSIPSPAPSTVPASSPIRNEPPPSSLSKRSYSYAISSLLSIDPRSQARARC